MRSSWLASSTKRRSRSIAASRRSSISFRVVPRRPSSSSVGGTGRRSPGSPAEISAARAAHRSTGRSAAVPRAVAGERCQEQGDGAADQEQRRQAGERLVAVVERRADRHRQRRTRPAVRPGARPAPGSAAWIARDRPSGEVPAEDLGGRDKRLVAGGLGEVDDGAVGPQHLHERLVLVAEREVVAGRGADARDEPGLQLAETRSQVVVDRLVEVRAELEVQERAERRPRAAPSRS